MQRGDTLAAIARRFDSTVEAIVEANRLEGPNAVIYPGQIVRVPIIGFR
ncbi:MAG: LysM peptidoglycan-binding domain-containing protein [Tepidanaerobacteraceae bacterium]|nr:LysM peptidoglycan-binding domain-containing protein [Tepidanaerobacteraceae bacterium]